MGDKIDCLDIVSAGSDQLISEVQTTTSTNELGDNYSTDIPLKLSTGTSAKSSSVNPHETTWNEFKKELSNPTIGEKDGKYFLRGYCQNNTRANSNMESAQVLVIDGDGSLDENTVGAPFVVDAVKALEKIGVKSCIYTSYSHKADDKGNRWRIIALTSRDVNEQELKVVTESFHQRLVDAGCNVALSKESLTMAQPWYYQRCPEDRKDAFYFKSIDGEIFDVDKCLANAPVTETSATSSTSDDLETANMDDSNYFGYFNKRNSCEAILEKNGYQHMSDDVDSDGQSTSRYLSPDSKSGSPGVIVFTDQQKVYCHSTSDSLANGHCHDAYSLTATLEYDGDTDALYDAIKADFEKHKKTQEHGELVNMFSEKTAQLPEDKRLLLEEVINKDDMGYELARNETAKAIGIKRSMLDSLRNEQKQIDQKQSEIDSECNTEDEPVNLTSQIIKLVQSEAKLCHDKKDRAYAIFEKNGRRETYSLDGKGFSKKLRNLIYKKLKVSPDSRIIKSAIESLSGIALYDGDEIEVYMRVGSNDGKYYIDLCNKQYQVVEIDKEGYRILNLSPVYFIRTEAMQSLPIPVTGDLKLLWKFVHIVNGKDRLRWLTCLIDSYRVDTVYPIVSHNGGEGTAKTTAVKTAKLLIDPSELLTRAAPMSVRDCQVAAENSHMLAFENMSKLDDKLSDTLCRISTGSGSAERALYTNNEETISTYKRPIMFEGIPFLLSKPDVIDRAINIDLPLLKTHISESQFTRDRNDALPEIFGAILEVFTQALAVIDTVQITQDVRMTDYALLGQAVYQVLGVKSDFSVDLHEHQNLLRVRALESSPALISLLEWLPTYKTNLWKGTPSDLLSALKAYCLLKQTSSTHFPSSGKGMMELLKRHTKTLACLNVKFTDLHQHTKHGNLIELTW